PPLAEASSAGRERGGGRRSCWRWRSASRGGDWEAVSPPPPGPPRSPRRAVAAVARRRSAGRRCRGRRPAAGGAVGPGFGGGIGSGYRSWRLLSDGRHSGLVAAKAVQVEPPGIVEAADGEESLR